MTLAGYDILVYVVPASLGVLAAFLYYSTWRRKAAGHFFGREWHRLRDAIPRVRIVKDVLIVCAVIIMAVAVLRPRWGFVEHEVPYEGSDLLFVLDVSNSMGAEDAGSSRLDRAKNAIRYIAESMPGNRYGLIVFAGRAYIMCPFTADLGAFTMFLDSAKPAMIQRQGTDMAAALEEAARVFEKERLTSKMMVLISDGEDHEGRVKDALATFSGKDIAVYAMGVGSETETPVAFAQTPGFRQVMRDDEGKIINTSKNRKTLELIARKTGGSYIDITDDLSGADAVLRAASRQQSRKTGTMKQKEPVERYQPLVLILILLLGIELFVPERRKARVS